jgi:hypothetical protein
MEQYEEAVRKLANHAGLPMREGEESLREKSLSNSIWLSEKQKTVPNLVLQLNDVLDCLQVLNLHFNGPDPNTRSGPRMTSIPDSISYPVTCILSCCLSTYRKWTATNGSNQDVLNVLLVGTHKIAFAWMQLLASDITDLLEGFEWA